jgi:hypothetical protein
MHARRLAKPSSVCARRTANNSLLQVSTLRGGNVISRWLWALPEYVPDDVEREDESAPEGDG